MGVKKMVLVEGNVGAGKTTAGKLWSADGSFGFIEEPVSAWQKTFADNLLGLFYSKPDRWAFTFQLAAFLTRAKTWDEVIAETNHSNVLLERSIYCDRYVFAKNCYQSGLMTKTEWQLYCRLWDWLERRWCVTPDRIVYLRTPAEVCYERILRRARKEEDKIPLGYLKDLEALHDDWLIRGDLKAITIDGEADLPNAETLKKMLGIGESDG